MRSCSSVPLDEVAALAAGAAAEQAVVAVAPVAVAGVETAEVLGSIAGG